MSPADSATATSTTVAVARTTGSYPLIPYRIASAPRPRRVRARQPDHAADGHHPADLA